MANSRLRKTRVRAGGEAKPVPSGTKRAPAEAEQVSGGSPGDADERQSRRFEAPHPQAREVSEVEGYNESVIATQRDKPIPGS
jgi:hypothetical protein